jgi:hypothetical protein
MTIPAWKDGSFTFNSQDLSAFVASISDEKYAAVLDEFQALGTAWPAPADTGSRKMDPVTVEFMADSSATGPNVKCALGTSATLTRVFISGEQYSGTFIASEAGISSGPDKKNRLTVVFTPSGTITWDLAA